MVEGDVFHGSMAGKLGEPKATFSIAKAAIPRTAAGQAQSDISHGSTPAKLSRVSREKQTKATFLTAQRQPSSHGFPERNSQRRHFSWLNASQAFMGFPRQTAKGDVSHGSTPAKLSWVSRDKQPKATFLMAQRQPSSHGFSERNSQKRHFSWLNARLSSHGFPERNSQRRRFS